MSNCLIPPRFKIEKLTVSLTERIDWGLNLLGIPDIWSSTMGRGIKVCILDTGADFNHVDIKDAIVDKEDFTGSPGGCNDLNGHGTHCLGIIAARSNNVGIVGIAPEVQILVGKVLGDDNTGKIENLVEGIRWAIMKKADIISMSLGSYTDDANLRKAIKDAFAAGIILLGAAGNESRRDFIPYPAQYPECIAVGSIDRSMQRSFFSNAGNELDIMAPGERVLSTFKGGVYSKLSGTSMATPFVAGVCALILAKHKVTGGITPIRNNTDMKEHLIKNAKDLGPVGFDIEYGYGLIDPKQIFFGPTRNIKGNLISSLNENHIERLYNLERERGVVHHQALQFAINVYKEILTVEINKKHLVEE